MDKKPLEWWELLPEGYTLAKTDRLAPEQVQALEDAGLVYASLPPSEDGLPSERELRAVLIKRENDLRLAGMDPNQHPFSFKPIVMPAVTPDEVLGLMRGRLNKEYMPSATGKVEYNSKPEYFNSYYGRRTVHDVADWSGVYCDEDGHGGCTAARPFWAFIRTTRVDILCNLYTDELTIMRRNPDGPWLPFDRPCHIDRAELQEQIELYL